MKFLKRLSAFFGKPGNVVLTFVAVMLVPNFVLAVTEPYSLTTILASILLPAGFYLLWALLRPNPGTMMLWAFPLMFLGAFQLVISYLFGNSIIAIDMFTNLFTTNVAEAGELLGSIYPSVIIVIVLYVPLIVIGIVSVRKKLRLNNRDRRSGVLAGAALMAAGLLFGGISGYRNSEFGFRYHIFPLNVCYNMAVSVDRWDLGERYEEMSRDFRFDARKTNGGKQREIYVFVIGEASRACSWSLFGYERETTPNLDTMAGIVPFRDVLTQSNTTHKSVPILLSPASAENYMDMYGQKSVVELFREAGFKTVFLSNQPPNHSLIDYFSAEADIFRDITSHASLTGEIHYDGAIIPYLHEVLNENEGNLFIVIHTYGSHANHNKRYPRSFAKFTPDIPGSFSRRWVKEIHNGYDNTILYTDHVLADIISAVDSTGACSALLYCADHGEDTFDDSRHRYLHASPTTTYYQLHIASFAWFSGGYAAEFPDKVNAAKMNSCAPVTTSAIFHTLAGMASIETRYADPRNSLVSDSRIDLPRMYINDYNIAVDVLRSGLADQDIAMFDKHHIKYDPGKLRKRNY